MNTVKDFYIYKHFKGNYYLVLKVLKEYQDYPIVQYMQLYEPFNICYRSEKEFLETLERNGQQFRRFEIICKFTDFFDRFKNLLH